MDQLVTGIKPLDVTHWRDYITTFHLHFRDAYFTVIIQVKMKQMKEWAQR